MKFAVRVKHYAEDRFVVQYSVHYKRPDFNSITYWFEQGLSSGTERWDIKLFRLHAAEAFAKSLKSMEDVERYYEAERAKEDHFYRRQKEYLAEKVPYKIKYFKK